MAKHCSTNAEAMGLNPEKALNFYLISFFRGGWGALFAVTKIVITTVMVIISSTVFLQFTSCSLYDLQLIAMLFGAIFAQQL